MTSTEKDMLKGITKQEAMDALVELNVQAALLSTKVSMGIWS